MAQNITETPFWKVSVRFSISFLVLPHHRVEYSDLF